MQAIRLCRGWALLILGALAVMACAGSQELYAPEVARMAASSVKEQMGNDGFNLIDARYDGDWEKSDKMIAGAVREDPYEVSGWAQKYSKTEAIIVYCA